MAFSAFIQRVGWLLIPVIIIGTPIVLYQLYKTEKGKRIMDAFALRFPVLGSLLRKLDTLRFARTLSALLNAGVDVGASLDLTADVMRLHPFRRAIKRSRLLVIQGEELSVALDGTRTFAPDVIAVLNSGEETGKIPESLVHVADDYEQQVEYTIKNLGQLVQPIITVVLGLIVLFIILAVFLPIISVIQTLSKPV
jgi:type II secretory pathway component PulF